MDENNGNGNGVIAFFTPEIAIDQKLPFYSGGLGVVSGDIARTAKRLNMPMVVVSLLPREGYYKQGVESDKMTISYERWENEKECLDDTGLIFPINLFRVLNWVKVWKLKDKYNTVPVFLLDTDIEQNDFVGRLNTRMLYGGSIYSGLSHHELTKRQLAQYYILGKGGVKALRRLKINVKKYHLNEAHSYFAAQEILSESLRSGSDFANAVKYTKSKCVFTTHTPVAAGNPTFPISSVAEIIENKSKNPAVTYDMLRSLGCDAFENFNMALACLRLSGKANTVSKKQLRIAKNMWNIGEGMAPLIAITNGVDQEGYWQFPEFRNASTPDEIAAAKSIYKRLAIAKFAPHFKEDVALIIWARRFAAYKRPKLLFHDHEWIANLLNNNKIQLIMAGKPHPDDADRIKDWNELFGLSKHFRNFVMLPGYELEMMRELQAAADIWLNTPRAPLEASGTSGMKANGAIHVSTPDGWACEADQNNCFIFGSYSPIYPFETHDMADAEALKICINNVLTSFYYNKDDWNKMMLNDTRVKERRWSTDRTLLQYKEEFYDA